MANPTKAGDAKPRAPTAGARHTCLTTRPDTNLSHSPHLTHMPVPIPLPPRFPRLSHPTSPKNLDPATYERVMDRYYGLEWRRSILRSVAWLLVLVAAIAFYTTVGSSSGPHGAASDRHEPSTPKAHATFGAPAALESGPGLPDRSVTTSGPKHRRLRPRAEGAPRSPPSPLAASRARRPAAQCPAPARAP